MLERITIGVFVVVAATGCVRASGSGSRVAAPQGIVAVVPSPGASELAPPTLVVGNFEDDYGARFSVSREEFFQRTRNHFRVVEWNAREQYLIAQNDSLNPTDAGRWTRIDWMPLSDMQPYEWAFCFSTYNAASRAVAKATTLAQRENPRTGCNGFPFTRMKRIAGQ